MKDKQKGKQREQTLTQLVTCPLCNRLLLAKPRLLPCGCCICDACVGSSIGIGDARCRCGRSVTPAELRAAPRDSARGHLVRLYTKLLSQGQPLDDETGAVNDNETRETEAATDDAAASGLDRSHGSRAVRLAALERRLDAWSREHRLEAEAAAAALDAAERALSDARLRLAEATTAGQAALEAARLRVRAAYEASGDPQTLLLKLPQLPRGRMAKWAAELVGHVTDGLRDAAGPVAAATCEPAQPPLIGRRSIALAGYRAVAACGVGCTDGYHSDAGGRVFEAASVAATVTAAVAAELTVVGQKPLPAECIAILMRRQRRMLRRRHRRPKRLLPETEEKTKADVDEAKILFIVCPDDGHSAMLTSTPALESASVPVRLAACPTAAQLFILTASQERSGSSGCCQRRLHVCQCGLDGRPAQTVELSDFRRRGGGADNQAAGGDKQEENVEEEEDGSCYEDIRIEANAKYVVVFSGGSAVPDAAASAGPSIVVLLDRTSLRAVQRLRLPDGASALHATPTVVWMRHAGLVKLVSQGSRQVAREWPARRLDGLFYATDVADADCGLAVATENCVRLFDRELQPLCRITGCHGFRLQHPVAVCRLRCSRDGGDGKSVLIVCDAITEEALMFALE